MSIAFQRHALISTPTILQKTVPESTRKCILVVDDDEDFRDAIVMLLAPRYCVRFAFDGLEGVAKAHEQPAPDLIIADVSMPGLDGISMVRRIRESDELRRVPVIFFSGQTSPTSTLPGLSTGTFAFLSKTSASGVLESNVKLALER
jgi:CheY-like chemotaxis protein